MIVLLLIMNALLGLSFTLGKMLLGHAAPCFIVAMRMLAGGVILGMYQGIRHGGLRLPTRRDGLICFQYAVLSIFAFPVLRAWGLQSLPSSKAAIFFALFPLSTALASFCMRGEKLRLIQMGGLVLGCIGLLPLFPRDSFSLNFSFAGALHMPELAIIASVIMLSFGVVTLQYLVKDRGCHPVVTSSFGMMMGGCLALIVSCIHEPVWIIGDLYQFLALLVMQTLVSNIICGILQAQLLQRYSATFMSFASFLAPISSVLYGIMLLREAITWHIFASLGLIALSLLCYHAEIVSDHVARFQRASL